MRRISDRWREAGTRLEAAGRWARFCAAMLGFGVVVALMVRSDLGLGPWDAFHAGVHERTGITIGVASGVMGIVAVALAWRLGVRPAAGTLVNMVLVALFIDLALPLVPEASGPAMAVGYYLGALALAGLCSGAYISTGLGNGPRDGLTMALCRRTGLSVRQSRTAVELVVLAVGWALGGAVGLGTVIFAFLMGPSMQWGMQLFGATPPPTPPETLPAPEEARAA